MEKPIELLSASKLRTLLIEETKSFIQLLDSCNSPELEDKRSKLCLIFRLLTEREKLESMPIVWGKNTKKTNILTEPGD